LKEKKQQLNIGNFTKRKTVMITR